MRANEGHEPRLRDRHGDGTDVGGRDADVESAAHEGDREGDEARVDGGTVPSGQEELGIPGPRVCRELPGDFRRRGRGPAAGRHGRPRAPARRSRSGTPAPPRAAPPGAAATRRGDRAPRARTRADPAGRTPGTTRRAPRRSRGSPPLVRGARGRLEGDIDPDGPAEQHRTLEAGAVHGRFEVGGVVLDPDAGRVGGTLGTTEASVVPGHSREAAVGVGQRGHAAGGAPSPLLMTSGTPSAPLVHVRRPFPSRLTRTSQDAVPRAECNVGITRCPSRSRCSVGDSDGRGDASDRRARTMAHARPPRGSRP